MGNAEYTKEVKNIISKAEAIAKEFGSCRVSSAHLLLAYLRAQNSKGGRPWHLAEDPADIEESIREGTEWTQSSKNPSSVPIKLKLTPEAQLVLKKARSAADEHDGLPCNAKHVLVGLVAAGHYAREILSEFTSPETIRRRMQLTRAGKEKGKPLSVNIRWMIRRDMVEVMDIERVCFRFSWTDDDFIYWLRQRNVIGMVAEYGDFGKEQLAGFMIYELHRNKIHLVNFAVRPDLWRRQVGSQMMAKLVSKLAPLKRTSIVLEVRKKNRQASRFLRTLWFKPVSVLHNYYKNSPEAALLWKFDIGFFGQKTIQAMEQWAARAAATA